MKHGVRPTREQRKLIDKAGLVVENWFVIKDTPTEMVLVHKYSDRTTKTIHKGENNNERTCNH